MTEYKTMRVPKAALEKARESKRETETWGEFLQRCSNEPPEIREFVEAGGDNSGECEVSGELQDIQTELESINSKLKRVL